MGYYPAMICIILNVTTNLTYGMMNSVVGGQILSRVTGGSVSVILGIIIVSLASFIMATFGMRLFQFYERYVSAQVEPGYWDELLNNHLDMLGCHN